MKNVNNIIDQNIFLFKTNDKKNKLRIIDSVIKSLPFKKHHFVTTMIFIFSMICEDYPLTFQLHI